MKRRVLICVLFFGFSMSLVSESGWAACTLNDVQGTWYFYSMGSDNLGAWWSYGTLKVKSNGAIRSGTSYKTSVGTTIEITGGSLKLSSSCIVKGKVKIEGGQTVTLKQGALEKDKRFFTGVWKNNWGDFGMFTAVKK